MLVSHCPQVPSTIIVNKKSLKWLKVGNFLSKFNLPGFGFSSSSPPEAAAAIMMMMMRTTMPMPTARRILFLCSFDLISAR